MMSDPREHPTLCYAINGCRPNGKRIIAIKRGEPGFYETNFHTEHMSDKELAQLVNSLNEGLGITRRMKAAMVWGSLYGFNTPGADPALYDEERGPIFHTNRDVH